MGKTIHLHLHGRAIVRTSDSPDWDESKHKRDKGGQFSSSGGGGGGASKPAKTESKAAAKSEQKPAGNFVKGPLGKTQEDYAAWALSAGKDPDSRLTIAAYERAGKVNPRMKQELEDARNQGHFKQKQSAPAQATKPAVGAPASPPDEAKVWRMKVMEDTQGAYKEWAQKKGMDPNSRMTVVSFVRSVGANPHIQRELETNLAAGNFKAPTSLSHQGVKHTSTGKPAGVSQARVDTTKGNHRPGWMLRADPELAKKFKEAEARAAERRAIK